MKQALKKKNSDVNKFPDEVIAGIYGLHPLQSYQQKRGKKSTKTNPTTTKQSKSSTIEVMLIKTKCFFFCEFSKKSQGK